MGNPVTTPRGVPRGKAEIAVRDRVLLGALGGLAPVLVNLAVTDPTTVFVGFSLAVAAGYLARVAVLSSLGGLMAWLHPRERNALRLFEIGIIAPALVTAMMNGAAAKSASGSGSRGGGDAFIGALLLPEPAYAAAPQPAPRPSSADSVFSLRAPPETTMEKFVRGLTGIRSKDRWFVVLDASIDTRERGVGQLRYYQSRGVPARLYGSGGPTAGPYMIVFGDWMHEDAAVKRAQALQARGVKAFPWYYQPRDQAQKS